MGVEGIKQCEGCREAGQRVLLLAGAVHHLLLPGAGTLSGSPLSHGEDETSIQKRSVMICVLPAAQERKLAFGDAAGASNWQQPP
jgi:hypothetical protein